MSPEERDDLIHFILQSQSAAAARHEEAMQELKEHAEQLKEQRQQIQALAAVSHDLVIVATRHSERLDRLHPPNL